MPGGTYAGNQGGSNIREAYLGNIVNCWLDRQDLMDMIQCSTAKPSDIEGSEKYKAILGLG